MQTIVEKKTCSFTEDEDIRALFNTYAQIISPLIVQLELFDGEFPTEILNEIRAAFTHLARCAKDVECSIYQSNVKKAEGHMKRALLDCFKYMCVSYDEKYREFDRLYRNVDLSQVDNGEFLFKLCKMRKDAVELSKAAHKAELEFKDVQFVFSAYETAFHAYADVQELIESSYEKLHRVQRKASRKDVLVIVSFVATIVSLIWAIGATFLT